MYQKVIGNNILIIGDLHISDVFSGRHKNYLQNCFDILGTIRDKVQSEKPCAVIFLGDLVGVVECNIRNRAVLGMLCKFFKDLNSITKCYVIRGNHDFGDYPEFQFLADLGLFETSTSCGGFVDYFGTEDAENPEVRFHLVDYGLENRKLDIKGGDTTDIVLAHNNFTIRGVTNWYLDKTGLELSSLTNFNDVYMVISGHIHQPSPEIYSTDLKSGGTCSLLYAGCPTRPSYEENLYESVYFVTFKYDNDTKETNYDASKWELKPTSEIFHLEDDFIEDKTEEQIANIERTDALKDVLDDIIKCRMTSGDMINQIRVIPNATDEAKDVAISYLQVALSTHV